MSEQINVFEKIKNVLTQAIEDINSAYRKRVNFYTNKDLDYFNGVAEKVGSTCVECVALNNCVFYYDNLSTFKHPNCKCHYLPIANVDFIGEMQLRKINEYLMINKDKKIIFEKLGYSIEDSEFLQKTISASALENYKNGNYILKNLDKYGQRMSIETQVSSKDRTKSIKFYSGWRLYPNGKIINTTPFGGWLKEKNK